jgi:hypothetical protein
VLLRPFFQYDAANFASILEKYAAASLSTIGCTLFFYSKQENKFVDLTENNKVSSPVGNMQ